AAAAIDTQMRTKVFILRCMMGASVYPAVCGVRLYTVAVFGHPVRRKTRYFLLFFSQLHVSPKFLAVSLTVFPVHFAAPFVESVQHRNVSVRQLNGDSVA